MHPWGALGQKKMQKERAGEGGGRLGVGGGGWARCWHPPEWWRKLRAKILIANPTDSLS